MKKEKKTKKKKKKNNNKKKKKNKKNNTLSVASNQYQNSLQETTSVSAKPLSCFHRFNVNLRPVWHDAKWVIMRNYNISARLINHENMPI